MQIEALLVTHKRVGLDELEKACEPDLKELLFYLKRNGANEAFGLQTCNRGEFYVTGRKESLKNLEKKLDLERVKYIKGSQAVKHLMRVSCGLESMVLGEDEILGQVKDAYKTAKQNDCLNGTLKRAVKKSIQTGKRARSETQINEGPVSIGSAAIELAEKSLGKRIEDSEKITVVGAGQTGELVANILGERGCEIIIVNRTYEEAKELAQKVGGTPTGFSNMSKHLDDTDLLVTATGAPHAIFDSTSFEGEDLLILDLANPRDVDPEVNKLEKINLLDIDSIENASSTSIEKRRKEVEVVEGIVDEEIKILEKKLKEDRAEDLLSELYEKAEKLRKKEKQRAIERLKEKKQKELEGRTEEIIDDLTRSLVNKLLSSPTQELRDAAAKENKEVLQSASKLLLEREENKEK